MNDITIEDRLNEAQNEYFGILTGLTKDGVKIDHEREFIYKWERLKTLQQNIINLTFVHREKSIESAKQSLEKAFTPKIKSMLSRKVLKEMEDG